MGLDQLIHHLHDIVNGQLRRSVRIKHHGADDVLTLLRVGCLDGQQLGVDIGHIHCRQHRRQMTHIGGMDSGAIHQARHLHAGVLREVLNQMPGVEHIAADAERLVANLCLHDIGRILRGALVRQMGIRQELLAHLLPAVDLIDTASGVLVERNVEAFNQFGILGLPSTLS